MSTTTLSFPCTTCPNNCELSVSVEIASDGSKNVTTVSGNRCPRGIVFAHTEVTRPERVLTTTVCVTGGTEVLLPVRSKKALPFDMHMRAMEHLRTTQVIAPITMGDTIAANILDSGTDMVASMNVDALS